MIFTALDDTRVSVILLAASWRVDEARTENWPQARRRSERIDYRTL